MAKVYMFRHQHHGIVTSHVFTSPPTPAQLEPLRLECERLHGREGWGSVHIAELVEGDAVPEVPSPPGSDGAGGGGSAPQFTVTGEGTVTQEGR